MLVCASCGTIVANVDPTKIRYGGCSSCSLADIKAGIKQLEEENGRP